MNYYDLRLIYDAYQKLLSNSNVTIALKGNVLSLQFGLTGDLANCNGIKFLFILNTPQETDTSEKQLLFNMHTLIYTLNVNITVPTMYVIINNKIIITYKYEKCNCCNF